MWTGKKWLGVVVGALAISGLIFVFRFVQATNLLGEIEDVDASCRSIPSAPGPEDIVIDRERGFAIVSATDRRRGRMGGSASASRSGGLYLIDLNEPTDQWVLTDVTPTRPEIIRPHGLGLFVGEDGARSLFVINHPLDEPDQVLILDMNEMGQLTHRRTISDPLMVNLNDIQPVGPDRFYASNDHGDGVSEAIQDFLLLDQTDLVYFDGEQARVAADGLTFANGVNVSLDGKQVYVAETLDRVLRIYERNIKTGALELIERVKLGTNPDNIDVLEDGDMLIGAHPKILDFASHAEDPEKISPSHVVRVSRNEDGKWSVETIYRDSGMQVSGVAVAAGYRDKMLLGPVFQPQVMVCALADAR